jgi:hypothetical protein
VFGFKDRLISIKTICLYILLICLSWNSVSCGITDSSKITSKRNVTQVKLTQQNNSQLVPEGKLSESAPPQIIQELNQSLRQFTPEVAILSPSPEEILSDNKVEVKLKVKNYSLFKDEQLGMGPHLNLIVDNQPYQTIYDLNSPIILENLAPGTHSLRVFAVRPWQESFKNPGAYVQTTFHILTKTNDNNPNPNLPLLTYNSPTGKYGAEPILLDFYLTNAPLHLIAQENPNDEIEDWHIRVTVNGESFLIEQWQSIYLQGFEKGNNWVQLELIDEDGNNIENAFNNTVRLVTYDPKEKDTLAKLVEGSISAQEARSIVEQSDRIEPVTTPKLEEQITTESKTIEEKLPKAIESEIIEESEAEKELNNQKNSIE